MNRHTFLPVLGAIITAASACGGDGSTDPPGSEFPRDFTAVSDSCTASYSLNPVQGGFLETTVHVTAEGSSEILFAGLAVLVFAVHLDITGVRTSASGFGDYEPTAVEGTWDVEFAPTVTADSWLATGVGTGDLEGRSIEFTVSPLTGTDCRLRTEGTIR